VENGQVGSDRIEAAREAGEDEDGAGRTFRKDPYRPRGRSAPSSDRSTHPTHTTASARAIIMHRSYAPQYVRAVPRRTAPDPPCTAYR
jgi:hypothetical protein